MPERGSPESSLAILLQTVDSLSAARTIADLKASENIKPQHIAEVVECRSLDRSVWA